MQRRVSNLRYVAWMQDVAVAHSAVCGWPMERYESYRSGLGSAPAHHYYKAPRLLGDVITAATWMGSYARRRSTRRYIFWNTAEKTLLAEAEPNGYLSIWPAANP